MTKKKKSSQISVLAELKKARARKISNRIIEFWVNSEKFLPLKQPSPRQVAIIKQESVFLFTTNIDPNKGVLNTKIALKLLTDVIMPMLLMDVNKDGEYVHTECTIGDAVEIMFGGQLFNPDLEVLINSFTKFIKEHINTLPGDIERGAMDGEEIPPKS